MVLKNVSSVVPVIRYNIDMKKIIILMFLMFFLSSCTLQDPISRSQDLSRKGKFKDAINVLEKEFKKSPNSVPVKSLLAQAYSDYGLALCQDTNKPPKVKYPMAKEQFAKALALNPHQQDAKEMHKMIEEIQETFRKNSME